MRDCSNRRPSLSNTESTVAFTPFTTNQSSIPTSEQTEHKFEIICFSIKGYRNVIERSHGGFINFFFLERSPCLAIVTKGILLLVMATS